MKPLRVAFAGTPECSVPYLEALHKESACELVLTLTKPDKPACRGKKLQASPVKKAAAQLGLPIWQPQHLKSTEAVEKFKELNLDLVIVFAYGLIVPQTLLVLPSYGWINIHTSLLPRWRGAAPVHRAILAGDRVSGVSLMQMSKGLDEGPILKQISCPLLSGTNANTFLNTLSHLGLTPLLQLVRSLAQGEVLTAVPQRVEGITYAKKLEKQEAQLDFNRNAQALLNQICAFVSPAPKAYFKLNAETHVQVLKASVVELPKDILPATIVAWDRTGLLISTGNSGLLLESIQFPNQNPVHPFALKQGKPHLFPQNSRLFMEAVVCHNHPEQ